MHRQLLYLLLYCYVSYVRCDKSGIVLIHFIYYFNIIHCPHIHNHGNHRKLNFRCPSMQLNWHCEQVLFKWIINTYSYSYCYILQHNLSITHMYILFNIYKVIIITGNLTLHDEYHNRKRYVLLLKHWNITYFNILIYRLNVI